jgi:hypothetical protein
VNPSPGQPPIVRSNVGDARRTAFDPLVAALAQLVRDRWERERAPLDNVVAMRAHQSKGASVIKLAGPERELAG